DGARRTPLTDGVDREELAVGQVGAEAEADQSHRRGGGPRELAREARGDEDHAIADRAEQGDRDAGELGVVRGLDLLAAATAGADRLDAGVVDVDQVARDAEARER